ncbi:hypothetical protein RU89_GL000517 [Lactococcus cremoris]|nr:hypothetical protein [Lactococcus cremoris]KZK12274.1 hypothetical protein AB995_1145 [Lactococcus cremoris]KZK37618.1 hypothetical protein LMG6897_1800 [Lactococcus cremoris]KZK48497.1 hypothetical protein FG2_0904 [Lactococcus cremoris]PCS09781.1 hypothetical protein RU89_GL000517 [Lactococcus cremoris]WKB12607.1 hypothetical protein LL1196_03190 [Lactococcus cremoris]
MVTQMSLTDYKINIPLEIDLRDYEFWVIYNDYQDQKIERIEKLLSE